MKIDKLVTSVGLTIGTVLFVSNSAQAASFTTNFTQENGTKGDVYLDSITQDGKTINQFFFVDRADLIDNDVYTGEDTGGASTDKGDEASPELTAREDLTQANADEIVSFLGNNNLSNIIDSEDKGSFKMNLFFNSVIQADDRELDSLFFWERGMNSDLQVQAIDADGGLIGNAITLLREDQDNAGFQINTTEVKYSQEVGSWGVKLVDDLGVAQLSGIQLYADENFNGPDFKVVAGKSIGSNSRATVPEPGTIIGLGSVAALAFARRRKSKLS